MDDKQYAKRALILAVTSFVLASLAFIFQFLSIFIDLPPEYERNIFGSLMLIGVFVGLPVAIIAYKMGKHMKGSFAAINLTRILSLLAILESSFWIFMFILVPVVHRYGPG